MSLRSYSLPDGNAVSITNTIITIYCFVLQYTEMTSKDLLSPIFSSIDCSMPLLHSSLLYISLLLFYFFAYFPTLSVFLYTLCPPSCKVPSFSPCHEMAAKGLSVWFLLSADPISKGPEDPALAPALLLSSPNLPQTLSY